MIAIASTPAVRSMVAPLGAKFAAPARQPQFKVLQSSRDPAQRSLFLPQRPVTR